MRALLSGDRSISRTAGTDLRFFRCAAGMEQRAATPVSPRGDTRRGRDFEGLGIESPLAVASGARTRTSNVGEKILPQMSCPTEKSGDAVLSPSVGKTSSEMPSRRTQYHRSSQIKTR